MKFETLKVSEEGALGRLTLARPESLNALSRKTLSEIEQAARWFDDRLDVRVVIVSGEGRAFTAGADLNDSIASRADPQSGRSWLARRDEGHLGTRAADALENMRATTIARIHGYAIGGGVVLVSACDFRIAAEDAVFSIPEVDLGIPLTWGAIPRLVRDIGAMRTKDLVMTCRRFSAAEAYEMGFINEVVPQESLDATVEKLANELAGKPSVPVAMTKAHVNAVAKAMSGGITAFADGDLLLGTALDPESRAAAQEYVSKHLKKDRDT